MFEIERKFLLTEREAKDWVKLGKDTHAKSQHITQAYLMVEGKTVWRVRLYEEGAQASAVWTFKKGTANAAVRIEEEAEMPFDQAKRLVEASERIVLKTRTKIKHDGQCFELDVFEGEHQGLVLVEIELPSADTPIRWPLGVSKGVEVTEDGQYRNDTLALRTEALRLAKQVDMRRQEVVLKV
jgi:adenylate cyclase